MNAATKDFVREVARMAHGVKWPEWARMPTSEEELQMLWATINHEPPRFSSGSKYAAYLASAGWRWRRGVILVLGGGECARCGGEASHVHHRSYKHRGAEKLNELEPLCEVCHDAEHDDDRYAKAMGAKVRR